MMVFAGIVFSLSLIGIIALFVFKHREERAGYVFAPALKEKGDDHALNLKMFLARCRAESSTWVPRAAFLSRVLLHRAALGIASLARTIERQAHRLADLVSHKHGFERRETRSDFLRQVSEYKNGKNDLPDII